MRPFGKLRQRSPPPPLPDHALQVQLYLMCHRGRWLLVEIARKIAQMRRQPADDRAVSVASRSRHPPPRLLGAPFGPVCRCPPRASLDWPVTWLAHLSKMKPILRSFASRSLLSIPACRARIIENDHQDAFTNALMIMSATFGHVDADMQTPLPCRAASMQIHDDIDSVSHRVTETSYKQPSGMWTQVC